jgi:hypothetical protein
MGFEWKQIEGLLWKQISRATFNKKNTFKND